MEQNVPHVLIGVPCERTVMVEAMNGLIKIATRVVRYGWIWFNFAYRRVDVARNMMGHWLLDKTDADYLCMLDSDHVHPEWVVERLVSCTMADPRIKIVGGMNYRRGPGYEPMAYKFVGDHQMSPIQTPEQPTLLCVDAISTASILIHREVFESMKPPWFEYLYGRYEKGECSTEDINFCRRIKNETKYDIWVHTGIVSPHLTIDVVADGSRREAHLAKEEIADVAP